MVTNELGTCAGDEAMINNDIHGPGKPSAEVSTNRPHQAISLVTKMVPGNSFSWYEGIPDKKGEDRSSSNLCNQAPRELSVPSTQHPKK
jgi:hypothetical protein